MTFYSKMQTAVIMLLNEGDAVAITTFGNDATTRLAITTSYR